MTPGHGPRRPRIVLPRQLAAGRASRRWWWGADGRTSAASSEPADCPFVQWPMPEPPNDHEIPPSPRRRRERDTLQPIATAPRDGTRIRVLHGPLHLEADVYWNRIVDDWVRVGDGFLRAVRGVTSWLPR